MCFNGNTAWGRDVASSRFVPTTMPSGRKPRRYGKRGKKVNRYGEGKVRGRRKWHTAWRFA